jgi:hypothetical protein
MALISGVLTNYVEDGYINDQDDFMVNGILDVGFTISAELTQSGWTHEAVFTPTANFSIQASLEIAHLTHEGELDATANFSIQASLEPPLTHGEVNGVASFSTNISGEIASPYTHSQRPIYNTGNVTVDDTNKQIGTGSSHYPSTNGEFLYTPIDEYLQFDSDFTIELWASHTFETPPWGAVTIIEARVQGTTDADDMYSISYDHAGYGNDRSTYFRVGTSVIIYTEPYPGWVPNVWRHFALTREAGTITAWIDGVSVGTATNAYHLQPDGDLHIGNSNTGWIGWEGNIDELRISNYAVYASNFTPPTTAFVADITKDILLVHFDGTNGQTTFVDDGVVTGSDLSSSFTTSITATTNFGVVAVDMPITTSSVVTPNVLHQAVIDETASTSYECTIHGLLGTDIQIDITLSQETTPELLVGAYLPIGMITNWSALGSPVLSTPVNIQSSFSTSITAIGSASVEVDVSSSFTQSTTASNLITIDAEGRYGWDNPSDWDNWGIWRNTWTLPTDFNTTILGGYVVEGELDISSSMVYECAIDGRLSGDILCEISSDMYTEGNLTVTGGVSINTSFGATVTALNNAKALCAISSSFTSDTYGINIKAVGLEVDATFTTSVLAKNNINTGLDISASVSSTIACGMVYGGSSDITSSFTQTTSGLFKTTDYNRYITVAPETRIISISEATRVLVIPSKIQTRNAA